MLGENIRRQRTRRDLKQQYVAERAGISQSAYSRIERDHIDPLYSTVLRIANAIGCHISDFDDPPPPPDRPKATMHPYA